MLDTDNANLRYDSYWSTTEKDKETFKVSEATLDIQQMR